MEKQPESHKYPKGFPETNPNFAKEAKDFEEGFWGDEQLVARFLRDENEYKNILDWLVSVRADVKSLDIGFTKDDEDAFTSDLSEARTFSSGAVVYERATKAFKVRRLRGDLVAMGINPELFAESKYEAWKQSRA